MTPEYFSQYAEFFALDRSTGGVLTLRFHTNGGPVTFTGPMHSALPRLLDDVAMDRDNRVVVITGTGDQFMSEIDGPITELLRAVGQNARITRDGDEVKEIVDEFYGINEFLGREDLVGDVTGGDTENMEKYAEYIANA